MTDFESFGKPEQTPQTNGKSTPPESQSPQPKSIGQIALALSKAQGEFLPVLKTREVDFVNNKGQRVQYTYADLADLIAATVPALSKYELGTHHTFEPRNGMFGMRTSLIHSSGEYISMWYPMPDPFGMKNQEFGSEITYARRYCLSMILGVASEEDDDGHDHVKPGKPPEPSGAKPAVTPKIGGAKPPEPTLVTESQLARLYTIVDEKGWTKPQAKEYLNFRFRHESSKSLTRAEYDEFVDTIVNKDFGQAMIGATKATLQKG